MRTILKIEMPIKTVYGDYFGKLYGDAVKQFMVIRSVLFFGTVHQIMDSFQISALPAISLKVE